MLDTVKELISHQFEAAFCALNACIDRCPESAWNAPVANLAFCQVAFHTLFFADYYLGQNEDALREQPFHRERPDFFRDYEELQPRRQQLLYDRPGIKTYLEYCRHKASEVMAAETAESLMARAAFRRTFSRAELHVYNIRHIQHHAAQLSLRLRLDSREDIPWFGSGWREA
jgi:hypothetical protein